LLSLDTSWMGITNYSIVVIIHRYTLMNSFLVDKLKAQIDYPFPCLSAFICG
jgi:hypothetical protein